MRKEHIPLHLHVKNSVRLNQAEAWMISFFLTSRQRKRKRAFFHESLLEGATHFMEEENDQDIINDVARGALGDKNRKSRGPLETKALERSNGPSSISRKVTRSVRRRCTSTALRLTSCLIPYGMGWS